MSAAKKLAVAKEVARLGLSFTKADEVILTNRQLCMLFDALTDPETVDHEELNLVIDEIKDRFAQSSVVGAEAETSVTAQVIPFPRKPEGE